MRPLLTGPLQNNMRELRVLRKQRDALDDQIQRLEWQTAEGSGAGGISSEEEATAVAEMLANLKEQARLGVC